MTRIGTRQDRSGTPPRRMIVRVLAVLGIVSALWAQSSVTYYATYKLNGGSATLADQSYTASAADTSAVWVTNSGVLTLTNPVIATSGNTSSQDNSSFYGLNAGLLVTSGSATMTGGSITTTGTGANGAFAYGSGSTVTISDATIKASADGGHAVMASGGGTMVIKDVTMTTSGGSSSAIATDRGGGTITVTGGTVNVSGNNSADLYSTGALTATGVTMKATGAETAVIEGANSITLNQCDLTGTYTKWGVMIYQSMSGDASGSEGVFTMTGGSLNYTPTSGPLFYVNNTTAYITLKGVTATAGSGVLLNAAAGSWGTSGSNGGTVVFVGDGQTLAGSFVADSISGVTATLKNSSALTGAINTANTAKSFALTLDATSTWTVTANSYLTTLADSAAISGSSISNIVGNGYNVYYDSSQSANSYLGGLTYSLSGGGLLLPLGSTSTCSYSAKASASSFAASGGSGTIAVTATSGCSWTATSDSSWLTISSGASGSGGGSVVFAVAANTNTSARTATVSIAGQSVTITEAASSGTSVCTYTVSPTAATFDAGGGSGTLAVTTTSGCDWTAVSGNSWITITSGASGTDTGTVGYTVAANTATTARTGTITAGGATLSVTQTNLGATAMLFVPITPCRLVDTRTGSTFGGAQFAAEETRSYTLPSSGCNVPSNAAAYSLNVAVVPVKTLGYLTLWPTGLPQPLVSTLNSVDGRIKSNAAIVPAGTDGAISLYVTNATDVVLDLNGYFLPASASTGLAFYPVTPCRLVDTRLAASDLGGPSFTAGQTRSFPLQGVCNLPTTAQAYSLNIAAVPSGPLGYITAWPAGVTQPVVATLNAVTGTVTANAAIVEAGSGGEISLYASNATDVVIDVNGYFAPAGTGGLSFYAVTPCRVVDTRLSNGDLGTPEMAAGETRALPLRESTSCTVSSAAEAYSLAAAVVPDSVLGYLTLWPAGSSQPYVATLNAVDGAITSNAAIVPAGTNGGISAYVTHATQLILDLNGYFAP